LRAEIGTLKESKIAADKALSSKQEEYEAILNENKKLSDYLKKVGISVNFKNTGREISELGKKQQNRKLTELKANVKELVVCKHLRSNTGICSF
jgi:hypothetical protein